MYGTFTIGFKFLKYWFTASNGKGHGIHSPFVFSFIENILNDQQEYPAYPYIEAIRTSLLRSDETIQTEDFGAGSSKGNHKQKKVAGIAKHAAKPAKYGQLLFRVAMAFKPAIILELGTSLGISTAYLALGNRSAHVHTIEGSPEIARIAGQTFEKAGLKNIRQTTGNFDETLGAVLETIKKPGLVFFDGNHRRDPTLKYFLQCLAYAEHDSIFIFDDIHWSREMEEAWELIKKNDHVTCTVDLFFIGIVFFRKELKEKQHFVIRF